MVKNLSYVLGSLNEIVIAVHWPAAFTTALIQCDTDICYCSLAGKFNDKYKGGIKCKLQCTNKSAAGIECPVNVVVTGKSIDQKLQCSAIIIGVHNHRTIKQLQLHGEE